MGWQERVRNFRNVADVMEDRLFDLAALMAFEVGKSRLEALGDATPEAEVRGRREERPRDKEDAGRDDIRCGRRREGQGPDREADLDSDGEDRETQPVEVPFGREEWCDRRRAEPRGHRQQLAGSPRSPAAASAGDLSWLAGSARSIEPSMRPVDCPA